MLTEIKDRISVNRKVSVNANTKATVEIVEVYMDGFRIGFVKKRTKNDRQLWCASNWHKKNLGGYRACVDIKNGGYKTYTDAVAAVIYNYNEFCRISPQVALKAFERKAVRLP